MDDQKDAAMEPNETAQDGASWLMPNELAEVFPRVTAWTHAGETGVGLVTWTTQKNLTVDEARALAARIVAAANYADRVLRPAAESATTLEG